VRLWFEFVFRLVEIVALLCARWPLRWLGNELQKSFIAVIDEHVIRIDSTARIFLQ
jgi:hypothetical protein